MANSFHEKIRASLSNPNLQSALDNNAERRLKARLQSYASSAGRSASAAPPRPCACAPRRSPILTSTWKPSRATAGPNGLIVHHARHAAQAVEIVLGIARQ